MVDTKTVVPAITGFFLLLALVLISEFYPQFQVFQTLIAGFSLIVIFAVILYPRVQGRTI
jgi:uncharacterized membrane protein YagU involved in acid resistance